MTKEELNEIKKRYGLTQQEIAQMTGYSKIAINKYCGGLAPINGRFVKLLEVALKEIIA